jgi:hypothetical protein
MTMTIQDLFVTSNIELLKVIDQIKDGQWSEMLPEDISRKPATLKEAIKYHTFDDAWVPDVLEGKTADQVGDSYAFLLTANDAVLENYRKYNELASKVVSSFDDLSKVTHLSYGDFPARDYLQHIISFRAFRSYDLAKMLGLDTTMDPGFVDALIAEFAPVIDGYRKMGVFPPALPVDDDASPQAKLLAMAGRD